MRKWWKILLLLCGLLLLTACANKKKTSEVELTPLPERTIAPMPGVERSTIEDYTALLEPIYIQKVEPDETGAYLIVTANFVENMTFSEAEYAVIVNNGFADLRWVGSDYQRYYATYGPDGVMYLDTDGTKEPWRDTDTILSDYALFQVRGEDGVYKVRQKQNSIVDCKRLGDVVIVKVPVDMAVYDSQTAHIAGVYETYGEDYLSRLMIPKGTAQQMYEAYNSCLCGGEICQKYGAHYTYITMEDGVATFVEYEAVYGDHAFFFR